MLSGFTYTNLTHSPIWRTRKPLAAKWQGFLQCVVTSPLVRLGSYALFIIDNFNTLFLLSGFTYKTFVNAATDAANAFRVRHIGNLFTNCFRKTSLNTRQNLLSNLLL